MKHMKKFMALFAALALVLTMAIPAMAAGGTTTYTITINNPVGSYEAYQIFSGDLEGSTSTLSNIKWGSGVSAAGQAAIGTAKDCADSLTDETAVKTFAKRLGDNGYLAATSGIYSAGSITGLKAGYYLIKNTADSVGTNETYTSFILQVVNDVTVSPKGDKPELVKKVKDANDTKDSVTGWQDSADYDIGDEVPFQLSAKIASNFADYSSYKFVFHDKQSDGLTFKRETVTVKVNGDLLNAGDYQVTENPGDGCTFHVEIPDLKRITSAAANADVVVEYKSKLNEHAVIGAGGNPNEAHLEYSNNPHNSNNTTTTSNDKVTVFTFKVVANKVDGANKLALKGAAFALYKEVKGSWQQVSLNNATENAGEYTIVDANKTEFTWEGLDDGKYKIVEIITPAGYNTIADQVFSIAAIHEDSASDPKLTNLTGTLETGEIAFTASNDNGTLTTSIENNHGTILPGTGGIGTTIFYVIGGGLMAAAAVLLVTKKRMENK